jgi:hypothetical protein
MKKNQHKKLYPLLKKPEIPDILNYTQIRDLLALNGITLTERTMNYYKTIGLMPKPIPRSENPKGDKRGYYPSWVHINLLAVHFLLHLCGQSLKDIRNLKDKVAPQIHGFHFYIELLDLYEAVLKKAFTAAPPLILYKINKTFIEALKKTGIPYLKNLEHLILARVNYDDPQLKTARDKLAQKIALIVISKLEEKNSKEWELWGKSKK